MEQDDVQRASCKGGKSTARVQVAVRQLPEPAKRNRRSQGLAIGSRQISPITGGLLGGAAATVSTMVAGSIPPGLELRRCRSQDLTSGSRRIGPIQEGLPGGAVTTGQRVLQHCC